MPSERPTLGGQLLGVNSEGQVDFVWGRHVFEKHRWFPGSALDGNCSCRQAVGGTTDQNQSAGAKDGTDCRSSLAVNSGGHVWRSTARTTPALPLGATRTEPMSQQLTVAMLMAAELAAAEATTRVDHPSGTHSISRQKAVESGPRRGTQDSASCPPRLLCSVQSAARPGRGARKSGSRGRCGRRLRAIAEAGGC